jgi:menaquinone-dependent protoporphyrinogen IX oxidase
MLYCLAYIKPALAMPAVRAESKNFFAGAIYIEAYTWCDMAVRQA